MTITGLWADLNIETKMNTSALVHPKDYGFIRYLSITDWYPPIDHFTGVERSDQKQKPFDYCLSSVFPFGSRRPRFRDMSPKVTSIYRGPGSHYWASDIVQLDSEPSEEGSLPNWYILGNTESYRCLFLGKASPPSCD